MYRPKEVLMMSVLDRAALDQSPLADLHAIASELSIDGYRRLRRPDLIDAILARQSGGEPAAGEAELGHEQEAQATAGRAQAEAEAEAEAAGESETDAGTESEAEAEAEAPSGRRRRGRRGGRGRGAAAAQPASDEAEAEAEETPGLEETAPAAEEEEAREAEEGPAHEEDELVEGVVELLPNGSGFLRVSPPEPSDDDIYISAAQVKRCELVSGDRVAGPRRAARRSERFASLVRVDTINGRPTAELASGARFDDLPAAFPNERFRLGSEDPTIKAIEWLTPFGKGSRVTIVGQARAGKTEALRRLAAVLREQEGLQLSVALAGVRPEEIPEWSSGGIEPAAAVSLTGSSDAQDNAVELVIDQARRIAARGADAVVLIDTLDGLHPHAARKAMGAARNIVDGGSLTVIATASDPVGGETTVIALDAALASTGRFPALDLATSGTTRPDLLVGEAGAEAIALARREALER
ncbi:MAG TPA: Rho termination factor N-terminal domain-containing protein [Solirubrobacteraceae bacterium]|nr:Rho termination factor N-terminal domain-containing protein [Solirubrobacteraceae bacterium]